jgi:hypothetical protein
MIWHVCFKTDALAPSRSGDEDETFTGAQISLIDVACCQGGRVERRAFALGDSLGSEIDRQRDGGKESPATAGVVAAFAAAAEAEIAMTAAARGTSPRRPIMRSPADVWWIGTLCS